MDDVVLNDIKSLYDSFDKINNMYEMRQVIRTIDCLHFTFKDNLDISKIYENLHEKTMYLFFEFLGYALRKQDEMDNFLNENSDFFDDNIGETFKNHDYDANEIVELPDKNISYIIDEFLMTTDEGLYSFYKKMKSEGRIILSSNNQTVFTSLDNSNTIIFICSLNNLKDIMILIHELGHAYYFYVNQLKMIDRDNINIQFKEEIPARILEKKFINFLYYNGVVNQATVLNDMYDEVSYKHDQKRNEYDSMKYVIAALIANNVKEKVNITRLFKKIYQQDIFELIKENKKEKRKIL